MNPSTLFQMCNNLALIGWILLIVGIKVPYLRVIVQNGIVSILLALVYAYCIFGGSSDMNFSDFGSLEGVMRLFTNETAVLAGWIHYLAFDLWVGSWELGDALKRGINRWLVVPCLFFTFMLGPVGLLLYLALRAILKKDVDYENF